MNREQMIAWLTLEGWLGYRGGMAYGVCKPDIGKHCWFNKHADETYYVDDVHWSNMVSSHCSMELIPIEDLTHIYATVSSQMP